MLIMVGKRRRLLLLFKEEWCWCRDWGMPWLEDSWFLRLLTNLLGYAVVVLPAALLIYIAKRYKYHDKPGNSWIRRGVHKFLVGNEPDLIVGESSDTKPSSKNTEQSFHQDAVHLLLCFLGLQVTYLTWGVIQEKIMTRSYQDDRGTGQFSDSQFLVFVNRVLAFVISGLYLLVSKQPRHTAPLYKYSYCSFSNIMSSWCQYEALKFISFPTQVLAKASKIIPVMLMGKLISKKSYPYHEYLTAILISAGMTMFLLANGDHKHRETVTTFSGVVILAGYMVFDSFTSNWQSEIFRQHQVTSIQMMCSVNFFSCILTGASLIQQGQMGASLSFMARFPGFKQDCFLLSLCSAAGQLFIFHTIATFGPVVFVIIMTIRQAIAIILSCIFYGHHIGLLGVLGITIVFAAIFLRIYVNQRRKKLQRLKCPVVGLEVREDDLGVKRIKGVITPSGTISTSCIVNCTGVWAPHIGKMAGVKVPLVPIKHAYVVTNRIENIQGTPNIRDHDLSIYIKLQGDALAIGGYEPNPEFIDHVPDDFAFSLYELNWDVFGTHIEQAIHRIPVLKDTGIKSTVCGPESFTPDHKPLLGEDPVVRGFYHGCGFNSLGMNAGGGCGRELARWLVHGRPQLDMYAYDIRRFHPKLLDNQRWIKERSHEAYAKNYSVVYPHDEPLAGRNQIKDSLYDDMLQSGCIFQERLGWERPGWFEPSGTFPVKEYDYYGNYDVSRHKDYKYEEKLKQDYSFDFPKHHYLIKKECLGCRENVAVFNMSYFGKYYLTGPDAQAAADWIFSNNVNRPAGNTAFFIVLLFYTGKSIYTCMLNKRGRVESDLVVSVLEPGSGGVCEPSFDGRGFYITAAGGTAQQNLIHIQQTVQDKGFNVTIADHSQDMGMLSVQGPRRLVVTMMWCDSRELLQSLTDTDLDDDKFPFGTNRLMLLDGHKVRALRLTFVGELGWELHIPRNSCTPVYRAIMAAGARYGVVNAGYRAIDSLSCEKVHVVQAMIIMLTVVDTQCCAGYRHWHADLRLDDNPLEAGLGFTCKLSGDTPFLGREALEGSEEPRKRLVGFTVPMMGWNRDVALWGLEAIWRNDRLAGWVRRAEFGHSLGQGVAWGYISDRGRPVSANWITEGEYRLESRGELVPAGVHLSCPLDPRHRRVRGDYSEPLPVNSD
ncbi:SARDH [Cordylochernes scorpioides]|uniref:Adenosine 3'-phospho 5'-phosphosulfate transporter 1 n=1 Tax=Cordylochernes scorpioides TaxID=51811 RepID=A0ABY6LP60_9ARAC|nr:SARDH [Cordylochernes scorpioides]